MGARVLTYILFALSLDLILGYAGIITLGHAAFFGLGAYVSGIISVKLGVTDPFLQLIAGALTAGLLGLVTGTVVMRTHGLTQLMLTLAVAAVCMEIANKATDLTGGADGLAGVVVAPILGMFKFDLFGKTAYWWCLLLLFICWWLVRRIIYSPFGASLNGIRENRARMEAIGAPVTARLVIVYTVSAVMAGIAGVLLTQTNQVVGLNVLGFELSGELMVMLILGGVGRLYGAFVGPIVFLIAQDFLAKQFPEYWFFGIGLLLVIVVLFARGGILGICDGVLAKLRGGSQAAAAAGGQAASSSGAAPGAPSGGKAGESA
ncbi:MAG: branched-chain amino acid ABC transporter permease [Burkholderiales bacterium]|nr:branched-chain amino acid ABC transporter permease [Burkholderiales bacterium]